MNHAAQSRENSVGLSGMIAAHESDCRWFTNTVSIGPNYSLSVCVRKRFFSYRFLITVLTVLNIIS